MRIVLVRHGEVDTRYTDCYNGHIDIALSKRGLEDARKLGNRLKAEHFDAIYCSDLRRAKETLSQFSHTAEVFYTSALREKSWGKHEGLCFDAIIAQGELVYTDFLSWIVALGGEEYTQYLQRIETFFLEFIPAQKHKNILVVTHAGVIRSLIHIVQKIPLEEAFGVSVPCGSAMVYYPFAKDGTWFDFSLFSS